MLKVIGITGGIATGKSTVSHYLISHGYEVVDCDQLTTQSYIDCFEAIYHVFPDCVENQHIIRPKLAKRVFSNESDKLKLENIIHPYVRKEMQKAIEKKESGLIFLDIPLLYEAKMEDLCDEIWVVYAPRNIQLERLKKRNQMDDSTAQVRIDAQMNIEEKRKKADVVIENTSSQENLYQQIKQRLEGLDEQLNASR